MGPILKVSLYVCVSLSNSKNNKSVTGNVFGPKHFG